MTISRMVMMMMVPVFFKTVVGFEIFYLIILLSVTKSTTMALTTSPVVEPVVHKLTKPEESKTLEWNQEELELKDMVTKTLEAQGTLNQLRAQLRAAVIQAMDQENLKEKRASRESSTLLLGLVHDYLRTTSCTSTLSVFEPECNSGSAFLSRKELTSALDLPSNSDSESNATPLLATLLQQYQQRQQQQPQLPTVTLNTGTEMEEELHQLSSLEAKLKEMETEDASLKELTVPQKEEEEEEKEEGGYDSDEFEESEIEEEASFPQGEESESIDMPDFTAENAALAREFEQEYDYIEEVVLTNE